MTAKRKVARQFQPTTDILTGIDRYKDSLAYGELVIPIIFLWREMGGVAKVDNMSGVLKSGTPVNVTDKKSHYGDTYYFVENIEQGQRGWCKAAFLERLGG